MRLIHHEDECFDQHHSAEPGSLGVLASPRQDRDGENAASEESPWIVGQGGSSLLPGCTPRSPGVTDRSISDGSAPSPAFGGSSGGDRPLARRKTALRRLGSRHGCGRPSRLAEVQLRLLGLPRSCHGRRARGQAHALPDGANRRGLRDGHHDRASIGAARTREHVHVEDPAHQLRPGQPEARGRARLGLRCGRIPVAAGATAIAGCESVSGYP